MILVPPSAVSVPLRGGDGRPGAAAGTPAFAALGASGPSARHDGVFRVGVLVPGADGGWRAEERLTADGAADAARAARLERDFGLPAAAFTGAPDAAATWRALAPRLAGRWTVCPERAAFVAWCARLDPDRPPPRVVGLDEIASLVSPGLGGPHALVAGRRHARVDALTAEELPAALLELVRHLVAFGTRHAGALGLAWSAAAARLAVEAPAAAERLAAALAWLDAPRRFAAAAGARVDELPEDGWWSAAVRASGPYEGLLDDVLPRAAHASEALERPSLPPDGAWVQPLGTDDRGLVERVFAELVPAHDGLGERPAQAAVARAVAASVGTRELLLLHAPTGTGKTLAYLVPALLFAVRNGLRVGVATYTRALQSQAMRRDVPLALALLARAAPALEPPRVAVLKGRGAYLCWRAFAAAWPAEDDDAARLVAAAHLLAFALGSPDGDLDDCARPVFAADELATDAELDRLLRETRADAGCCTTGDNRATCAAELARKRAERAHLVVTNQALVLARQDFLRHVVFDECEHLHDQAHAAFSHRFGLATAKQELARLAGHGAGRAPLERLAAQLDLDAPAREVAVAALDAAHEALAALAPLELELARFHAWRRAEAERVGDRAGHALCVDFVASEQGRGVVEAHGRAARALRTLVVALARLPGELVGRASAVRRLVRRIERSRVELEELCNALVAWLPTVDGALAFRRETFYDVEEQGKGFALVARVLLPPEVLGRHFYPQLAGAVLVSATTWLRGGFDAARGYLGLDRAAQPADDEQREPCVVRTERAPESFDYGRVLVAVPSDTPAYADGKGPWIEHVARFVAHLVERTDGRTLVLFTAADDCAAVARVLDAPCRAAGLALLWQGMPGESKERLVERFRAGGGAVLLGLDTFWFGADFPGDALEYVVIAKLPYGVPDRYHHAQAAALSSGEHRRRIYLPRALARFRQGFGRLMRRDTDRGCVFVLDRRANDARHRLFLAELPLGEDGARLVTGSTDACLAAAFAHMRIAGDVAARGLDRPFDGTCAQG